MNLRGSRKYRNSVYKEYKNILKNWEKKDAKNFLIDSKETDEYIESMKNINAIRKQVRNRIEMWRYFDLARWLTLLWYGMAQWIKIYW